MFFRIHSCTVYYYLFIRTIERNKNSEKNRGFGINQSNFMTKIEFLRLPQAGLL